MICAKQGECGTEGATERSRRAGNGAPKGNYEEDEGIRAGIPARRESDRSPPFGGLSCDGSAIHPGAPGHPQNGLDDRRIPHFERASVGEFLCELKQWIRRIPATLRRVRDMGSTIR